MQKILTVAGQSLTCVVERSSAVTHKGAFQCCTSLDSQPTAAPQFDPIAHYCIVRTDLPVGLACAQLIHAAGESSPGSLDSGTYAIALGVPDESTLTRLADNLAALGVQIHRVVESQGKYHDQLMAIGVKPGHKSVVGRYMTNLPLLRLCAFREYDQEEHAWAHNYHEAQSANKQLKQQLQELQAEYGASWAQRLKRWWKGA